MAEIALRGVGDPKLGEWREQGRRGIVHIRRRLTDAECDRAGGLSVRDIRGTQEERHRFTALLKDAPHLRGLIA